MGESRAIKNVEEIEAMKMATRITCEAHIEVMRKVRGGMREKQIESIFNSYCSYHYFTGRVQPYCSIVCCGPNAATLHY
jgi:Xaa-Pro aminopeptidase